MCKKLKTIQFYSPCPVRKKFHAKQMFVLSSSMKLGPGHWAILFQSLKALDTIGNYSK